MMSQTSDCSMSQGKESVCGQVQSSGLTNRADKVDDCLQCLIAEAELT